MIGNSVLRQNGSFVAEAIADSCERLFALKMAALKIGDPFAESTELGTVSTPVPVTDLDRDVGNRVAAEAKVLTGRKVLDRPGNFHSPRGFELPTRADSGRDMAEQQKLINQLDAGMVFRTVACDPRIPFAGRNVVRSSQGAGNAWNQGVYK